MFYIHLNSSVRILLQSLISRQQIIISYFSQAVPSRSERRFLKKMGKSRKSKFIILKKKLQLYEYLRYGGQQ